MSAFQHYPRNPSCCYDFSVWNWTNLAGCSTLPYFYISGPPHTTVMFLVFLFTKLSKSDWMVFSCSFLCFSTTSEPYRVVVTSLYAIQQTWLYARQCHISIFQHNLRNQSCYVTSLYEIEHIWQDSPQCYISVSTILKNDHALSKLIYSNAIVYTGLDGLQC